MADRVSFLIDGFNVYHSIVQAIADGQTTNAKWLDYRAFCQSLLTDVVHLAGGALESVSYFSAYAHHSHHTVVTRHRALVKALEGTGVRVVLGNFKEKWIRCKICHGSFRSHEEKETDVNIALALMECFHSNECDTAIIMSGDTDLVAAVTAAKRRFPGKRVGVAFPYKRVNNHFRKVADFTFNLGGDRYENYQFPDPLTLPDGTVLPKPVTW